MSTSKVQKEGVKSSTWLITFEKKTKSISLHKLGCVVIDNASLSRYRFILD